jgi:hypothetical protein
MNDTENILDKHKSLRDFLLNVMWESRGKLEENDLVNLYDIGSVAVEMVISMTELVVLISAVDEIITMMER